MDNRLCYENCFPTADSAAKYLGALSSMEKLRFPYPIKEVRGECKRRTELGLHSRGGADA